MALNFSASEHDCLTVPIFTFSLRILFTSAWIVSGAAATVDIVVAIMPIDASAAVLVFTVRAIVLSDLDMMYFLCVFTCFPLAELLENL